MPISDNIKKLRQIFDVTQDELGEIAGVTGNAVSQWENGRSEPRMGAIERMAACYQISKSHLIEDGGMDQIDPVTKKPKAAPICPPCHARGGQQRHRAAGLTLGRVHAGALADEEEIAHRVEVPASVCAGIRARSPWRSRATA